MKYLKTYRLELYGILILFIVALLQSSLLHYFRFFYVKPDIILATLVIFVFFYSLRWSVIFALLAGVFRDVFSILPFGFNAVICILWVFLVRQISLRLSVENNLIRSATLFIIILLNNLALSCLMFILDKPVAVGVFLKVVFWESVLTLLLAFPMYRLLAYLLSPLKTSFERRLKFQIYRHR